MENINGDDRRVLTIELISGELIKFVVKSEIADSIKESVICESWLHTRHFSETNYMINTKYIECVRVY